MSYSQEDWARAKALYLSGNTYDEVSEQTGISASGLQKRGCAEDWNGKRNVVCKKNAKKIEKKITETLAEQQSDAAVDVLLPLKKASTALVEKALAMVPECERTADIRALSSSIKDLLCVIRDLNDMPGYKDRIEDKADDGGVRFVIEVEGVNND